jgi:hypothetical protein
MRIRILRHGIKIENSKNLNIATYKENFSVPITHIKFLKINSECYTIHRTN